MARKMIGKVVSDKMDKTVVVTVGRLKTHPIYKKKYKTTARFKAHDEKNDASIGDIVEITEGRPLSRDKTFVVTRTIERSKGTKQ